MRTASERVALQPRRLCCPPSSYMTIPYVLLAAHLAPGSLPPSRVPGTSAGLKMPPGSAEALKQAVSSSEGHWSPYLGRGSRWRVFAPPPALLGLLEALNRHSGKGQQQVWVEHVHVHQGGQAIVGAVQGGYPSKVEINPMHQGPSRMNQARRCRAKSKRSGKPCRAPAVRGWAVCRMHGAGGGAPLSNRNALRHGMYTGEAIATRQAIRLLLCGSRELLEGL
jgi:hypothetical protein